MIKRNGGRNGGTDSFSMGERKRITILFADINGSTAMIDGLDPEQADERLQPILDVMTEAVERYDGTVHQWQGDGIVALFGAPVACEHHAVHACCAALAMQDAVRQWQDIALAIRVGLHSGEVVMRPVKGGRFDAFDVIGPAVHLAARMEQSAEPGTIRLTAETARLAGSFIEARLLGPLPVRGLSRPVEVMELVRINPRRTRWAARAGHGLTDFTGRDREMAVLTEAIGRAEAGVGQLVTLVGEPGMGKSRLVHEFIQSTRTRDWSVAKMSAMPFGRNIAYLPIASLVRSWLQIRQKDDPAEIGARIETQVGALGWDLVDIVPALRAVLDLPVEDAGWRQSNPAERRGRIIDGLVRLILRGAETTPLLILVEDLHWLDSETLAVIDAVVRRMTRSRLMVIATWRPEFTAPWNDQDHFSTIEVGPLGGEPAQTMLMSLLGAAGEVAEVVPVLLERAAGTPLVIEEMVRTLVATGALAGRIGSLRLTGLVADLHVPDTIEALIAERIDRLPFDQKNLLQAAAVIGRQVPLNLLRDIARLPDDRLRSLLGALEDERLLRRSLPAEEVEYEFTHAFVHEVVCHGLLRSHARVLHALTVEVIERQFASRLGEQVVRLAEHALLAEMWDKAVGYFLTAIAQAVERSANREAVALFEHALTAAGKLPPGPAATEAAIDLRLAVISALLPLGEHARLVRLLDEARDLAIGIDDRPRLARIYPPLIRTLWMAGEHNAARAVAERAVALADELGDPAGNLAARFHLGLVSHALGEYRTAVELHGQVVAQLAGPLALERFGWAGYPSVISRSFLAWSLIELGEFDRAAEVVVDGQRLAARTGHAYSLVMINAAAGLLELRVGRPHRAVALLETAATTCAAHEVRTLDPLVCAWLGMALARAGEVERSVALLEPGDTKGEPPVGQYIRFFCLLGLAEAYRAAGRHGEALVAAEKALDLARSTGEQGHAAHALVLIGDVVAAADPERAAEVWRRAVDIGNACGMRPLVAECRYRLGELSLKSGCLPDALAELTIARDLFEQIELGKSARQIEAVLADIGCSDHGINLRRECG
jgi:class 3 adenylate cyclase/tetratricopeptide (TPR) repeat protein